MRNVLIATAAVGLVGALYLRAQAEDKRFGALATQLEQISARLDRPTIVVAPRNDAPAPVEHALRIEAAAAAVAPAVPVVEQRAPAAQPPNEHGVEARQTLEGVLGRGHLAPEDVAQLRNELVQADSPELSHEVHRQIAAALTRGELKPDDPHHIFP